MTINNDSPEPEVTVIDGGFEESVMEYSTKSYFICMFCDIVIATVDDQQALRHETECVECARHNDKGADDASL